MPRPDFSGSNRLRAGARSRSNGQNEQLERRERHVGNCIGRRQGAKTRAGGSPNGARPSLACVRPLHHAQDPTHRNAERRGPRNDRAQRRDAIAGDRHRVSRLSPGACSLSRRRLRHQGRAGALSARSRATALRDDAFAICAARAQPRAQRRHRRRRDGLCAELWLALRPRPRQGPPLRNARRLPELRQARLHEPVHPPFRRNGVRAGRPAGQQAPSRDGLFAYQILRQAVHGLGH